MRHIKTYVKQEVLVDDMPIVFEGSICSESIKALHLNLGLCAFRPANQQHSALQEISNLEEGRIYVARIQDRVIGYVTFHYPDPLERWSEAQNDYIIELGAVEVAREYRRMNIASTLMKVAFTDPAMDEYVVFTTGYYWHWDMENCKVDVWGYRKIMERLLGKADFICLSTDDPEVCSHPANCLLVRVGKKAPRDAIDAFEEVRFQSRYL